MKGESGSGGKTRARGEDGSRIAYNGSAGGKPKPTSGTKKPSPQTRRKGESGMTTSTSGPRPKPKGTMTSGIMKPRLLRGGSDTRSAPKSSGSKPTSGSRKPTTGRMKTQAVIKSEMGASAWNRYITKSKEKSKPTPSGKKPVKQTRARSESGSGGDTGRHPKSYRITAGPMPPKSSSKVPPKRKPAPKRSGITADQMRDATIQRTPPKKAAPTAATRKPAPKASSNSKAPVKKPKRNVAETSKSFRENIMKKYNFANRAKGAGDKYRPSKKEK